MPVCEKIRPPEYLREARLEAGYISRGTAATAIPYSPETIGRHERGDVELRPEDAVIYAEGYKAPEVMFRYCSDCPVGRKMGRSATERTLPFAALRVRCLITEAQRIADRLEQIAFDGLIDQTEREDFDNSVAFLRRLDESINDFLLIGCKMASPRRADSAERPDN